MVYVPNYISLLVRNSGFIFVLRDKQFTKNNIGVPVFR